MTRKTIGKLVRIFACIVLLSWAGVSQDIIENPDKPLSPKAGRLLGLREELRINDEGGKFFFKYPRYIKVAPDGSYFVSDQDELLHFDTNGVLLRDFFKKGQGPGELNTVDNFGFDGDLLLVHNNNPNKFVWFSYDGALVKELRLQDIGRLDFEHLHDDVFYGFKMGKVDLGERVEVIGIPRILLAISKDGTSIKELASFSVEAIASDTAWASSVGLQVVPFRDRYFFLSHTSDYLVKLCDLRTGEVIRSFNRRYKRVKRPEGSGRSAIIIGGTRHEAPGEYLNDISAIFAFKDVLWVQTPTKHKEKGFLIDVFDFAGRYIDAFYLDIKGRLMGIHEDRVFVREQDEEGLINIVKFRVVDE